jgi:hypothetical protein
MPALRHADRQRASARRAIRSARQVAFANRRADAWRVRLELQIEQLRALRARDTAIIGDLSRRNELHQHNYDQLRAVLVEQINVQYAAFKHIKKRCDILIGLTNQLWAHVIHHAACDKP